MTTKAVVGIGMAVALVALLALLPAASLALSAEESPEPTAACVGTGTATIMGHVKTPQGGPIPNVTMKLSGPNNCTNTTTTNSNGSYSFRQLGPGTYTVSPSKTGCTFIKAPSKNVGSNLVIINFIGDCPV